MRLCGTATLTVRVDAVVGSNEFPTARQQAERLVVKALDKFMSEKVFIEAGAVILLFPEPLPIITLAGSSL